MQTAKLRITWEEGRHGHKESMATGCGERNPRPNISKSAPPSNTTSSRASPKRSIPLTQPAA
eukprot:6535084-Pyramimonas_sp.AAC.1